MGDDKGTDCSLPLTAAQLGIWFSAAVNSDKSTFNIVEYSKICGPVDFGRLSSAIRRVAAATSVFHTSFLVRDGIPRQYRSVREIELEIVDFSLDPHCDASAEQWILRDSRTITEINQGELYRLALIRLSKGSVIIYIRCHHVLIDQYGIRLVLESIDAAYKREESLLSLDAVSQWNGYAGVVHEDALYHASNRRATDGKFWREHLEGFSRFSLSDKFDSAFETGVTIRHSFELTEDLNLSIEQIASSEKLNWSRLGVAFIIAYLQRASGSKDLTISLLYRNRDEKSRHVPAMLVNTLPLRIRVEGKESIATIGHRIDEAICLLKEYGRFPGYEIDRLVGTESRGFGPIVNIVADSYASLFNSQISDTVNFNIGPVSDFSFHIYRREKRTVVHLRAKASLYTHSEVVRHALRLQRLLAAVASDPGMAIGDIDVLSPDERRQL
ncbi:hypothetical protein HFO10_35235, partial [Rhizobium laguerreae]|uniref:condensation domain-containing protein n=1 Tax=Rhizobium laguerreae TaxID=1076926 RepID=UPI001C92045F